MSNEPLRLPEILDRLARLHDHKTVGYGNAWRKRGELLSIFTNLARKYDRLTVALDDRIASQDEPLLLDTAADLCVYSAKYLSWLAETEPAAFEAGSDGASAQACSDAAGPDALRAIFVLLDDMQAAGISDTWGDLKTAFMPLEVGLLAQAGVGDASTLPFAEKTRLTWSLTAAAAQLTLAIALARPHEWQTFLNEVDAMDLACRPADESESALTPGERI